MSVLTISFFVFPLQGCGLGLVFLPHRVLFGGKGGGHLCLPQVLLTKVCVNITWFYHGYGC